LVVFVGSIWLVYHFIDKPRNLAIIFGASGVTIAGMVYYMTDLWRQWWDSALPAPCWTGLTQQRCRPL
jgi:hypothetical protein